MLPEGHRLHVVLEGISRGLLGGQHPQVRACAPHRLPDLVELGSLTPRGGGVPRGVGAGRPQHPGRRRHPGRQDHDAQLPGGGDPRRRAGGRRSRRSSSCGSRTPTGCALQTRQSGLEGTGEIRLRDLVKESLRMRPSRIIVGEVRAEECLDLLLALNAGLPGHVHDPRQQRPRGAGEDVHAAAAGGREHLGAVRGADGRGVGRPRRAPRHRRARRTPGQRDRRRCPAGSRTTSSRPSRSSCGDGDELRRTGGHAAAARAVRAASASTCTASCTEAGGLMGALVGLGRRRRAAADLVGVLRCRAQPRPDRARPAGIARAARPGRAGRGLGHRVRGRSAWCCGAVAAFVDRRSSRGRRRWRSPSG